MGQAWSRSVHPLQSKFEVSVGYLGGGIRRFGKMLYRGKSWLAENKFPKGGDILHCGGFCFGKCRNHHATSLTDLSLEHTEVSFIPLLPFNSYMVSFPLVPTDLFLPKFIPEEMHRSTGTVRSGRSPGTGKLYTLSTFVEGRRHKILQRGFLSMELRHYGSIDPPVN